MRHTLIAGLIATPLAFASSAAMAQAECAGIDRPIVLSGLDWDSNAFHNGVVSFILENGYGCDVEEIPGSTIPLLNGMIRGDIDITMEVWLPNVRDAWEAAGDAVQIVGTSYPDATQGWFVPKYMVEGEDAVAPDLKSVSDLPKYADQFPDPEEPGKGRFLNCILGWGCEQVNSKKLQAYGLTDTFTNFRPGTSGAMNSAIESAVLREKPIVFYYWSPTWIMGKIGDDVIELEEPEYNEAAWNKLTDAAQEEVDESFEATAYPTVEVNIGANSEFVAEAGEIMDFLGAYQLDSATVSNALAYMQDENASSAEAAEWWLSQNTDRWQKWVPAEVAERVNAALASS